MITSIQTQYELTGTFSYRYRHGLNRKRDFSIVKATPIINRIVSFDAIKELQTMHCELIKDLTGCCPLFYFLNKRNNEQFNPLNKENN